MINFLGVDIPYGVLLVFAGVIVNLLVITWINGIDGVCAPEVFIPFGFGAMLSLAQIPTLTLFIALIVWLMVILRLVNELRPRRR